MRKMMDFFDLTNSIRYGMPFVSPNNLLVSTINGTGAAIESIYVIIFLVFAPKKEKAKISAILALVVATFTIVACISLLVLHGNGRKLFCGIAATVFSIIMYGSPLTIMVCLSFLITSHLLSPFSFSHMTCFILHEFEHEMVEAGGENEERGIHAVLLVTVRVLVWHFLVYLRSPGKGSFRCCKYILNNETLGRNLHYFVIPSVS